ncbi:MAG TPA: hypothetical protein VMM17_10395 [Gemmatimonadaceae bacterium]|nr:hypothetical protein [Gemmatimonadaceae bacterium]
MSEFGVAQQQLTTIEADGKRYAVTLRTAYDGVEHVGRLFFTEVGTHGPGIPDHSAIPGRTVEESVAMAQRFTHDDLMRRLHRAHADKRRYTQLRRAVDEIVAKVKYMNRVAVSMRGGMIDTEGASQELDLIEKQLLELVRRLKTMAGVEG